MGNTTFEQNSDAIAQRPSAADVDFHRKSIANKGLTGASALTVRQSIWPITLVTILFFLWGFAYGLLDVLNAKFQTSLNITAAKAGGLQGAYFGAYFIGPLTYSGWIVRKYGYRWTFIAGLIIYGIGALMFWPSAVYKSFPGFCGSLFIVGSGLSTLETSANPFIATCGPPRLSEFRLELSQSFQAVGSVAAPSSLPASFSSRPTPTTSQKSNGPTSASLPSSSFSPLSSSSRPFPKSPTPTWPSRPNNALTSPATKRNR